MTMVLDGTSGVTFPAGGSGNVAGSVVGTTDTQSLTNKSLNGASFGTVSGSAPLFLCRAWVNFNGTGTVAIRASGNVSSITDNGVGNYTVNFTTAMPDADYAVVGAGRGSGSVALFMENHDSPVHTASAVRVYTLAANFAPVDCDIVDIMAVR